MNRWASIYANIFQYHKNRPNLCLPFLDLGHLLLLFVMAVLITFFLATGNVTAKMLFQSPQSPPVEQPPAEQQPTELPPTEQPPAEQLPAEQAPAEQPSTAQPSVESLPTEQPPTEIETPAVPPISEVPASRAPLPEPIEPRRSEIPGEFEDEEARNFILDEIELVDSIVVSGAYIWLCCGIASLLIVPLSLLLVYIRGLSKIAQEEDS